MLANGNSSPISYKTNTTFTGSIISIRSINIENHTYESVKSTVSSSNSNLTELSIFTFHKPLKGSKNTEESDLIEHNTCKCLIY